MMITDTVDMPILNLPARVRYESPVDKKLQIKKVRVVLACIKSA